MDQEFAETGALVEMPMAGSLGLSALAGDVLGKPRAATSWQSGLPLTFEAGSPVLPQDTAVRRVNLALKRVLDVALSLAALVFLAPLLILTALAVKATSPGPVFFVQMRPGYKGTMFPMLKFRTMYADLGDASGVKQTVANDPRVTPIGTFLRKTSIDELPQLINILLGHMSLVGPRPHPANMRAGGMAYEELVPYYDVRYEMRPGLSGWAQANGYRGPTVDAASARDRIAHDVAYIQNFSVWLDIRVILTTLRKEFLGGSGF
jgi:Sugar transferases involved in lipopolysaccharide synthesis